MTGKLDAITPLPQEPPTVLIVDDQPENLDILAQILKPYYRVKAARSGQQALYIAALQPHPDLILLDVMMPGMDGFTVLTRLLENAETATVPVIFVTASNNPQDEENAFRQGAVDFLTKPVYPPVVLARVRLHLALKQAHDSLAEHNSRLAECVAVRSQELEQSQQQLRQAEKMAAVGQLAGGIAHDFNNILTPIIGFCEIVMDDLGPEHQSYGELQQIFSAGLRAKEMVAEILAFARENDSEKKPVRFSTVIQETLHLLRPSLPASISLQVTIAPEASTAAISASPTQVPRLLMNLCTNAMQAMQNTGGILTVHLTKTPPTARKMLRERGVSWPCLQLIVSDTGHGMEETVRQRIFEPYFTTKKPGEGTGLGLAMVYSLMQDLHGSIEVRSIPGSGTDFILFLPYLPETASQSQRRTPEQKSILPAGLHVLYVDDERSVAQLGEKLLTRLGLSVITCTDSQAAVACVRTQPDTFDLIITDQTMPGLTGLQLAREIRAIRPELPVLLCTGNEMVLPEVQWRAAGIQNLLPKPFRRQDLVRAITSLALGGKPAA